MDGPIPTYLIASTPRSGSSLLCDLLRQAGAGKPDEYFHLNGTVEDGVLERAKNQGYANGVIGIKTHWSDVVVLGLTETLLDHFPAARWISLGRRSILRQAISLVRARQTQQWGAHWTAKTGSNYERVALEKAVVEIISDIEGWEGFFHRHGLSPFRIVYEEFAADTAWGLLRVMQHLGLPLTAFPTPTFARQADAVTEEWVQRFLTENR